MGEDASPYTVADEENTAEPERRPTVSHKLAVYRLDMLHKGIKPPPSSHSR
jgi:hypothetical protein